MAAKVGSRSFTSCRCAPLTTNDSGIPRASTSRLRLVPFFPPIRRIGAYGFLRQRRFHHRAVYTLPGPSDVFHRVVLREPLSPHLHKHASLLPVQEVFMHRACASVFFRQCLPLAAGTEHIHDRLKHSARLHGFAPSARSTLVLSSFRAFGHRDQGRYALPQCVGYGP